MVVTTDYKCPATHPDEVLYDLWPGATIVCDCIERDGQAFRDIKCSKGKDGDHNGAWCYEQLPMPPVVQANLNGHRICGKRYGDSYLTTPVPTNQTCPVGYKVCSS